MEKRPTVGIGPGQIAWLGLGAYVAVVLALDGHQGWALAVAIAFALLWVFFRETTEKDDLEKFLVAAGPGAQNVHVRIGLGQIVWLLSGAVATAYVALQFGTIPAVAPLAVAVLGWITIRTTAQADARKVFLESRRRAPDAATPPAGPDATARTSDETAPALPPQPADLRTSTLAPGATLGRYQVLELLGRGGMAAVYRAYQPALDRVVALKVLRAGLADDPEFLERFQREAQAIARLEHPHVVQVFDFDHTGGVSFMAMQYLEGGTLKAQIAALADVGRRLEPRQIARLISEVAQALDYAHGVGIVHRDVKPSNILLARGDRAVVSDFGIAKILGAKTLTETGVGIGTPEYMSPEQGLGKPVDHRSDIYSLGVVAYELLTGRVPFVADTPYAIVLAHVRDPLPLPATVNPALGQATERVLLKALAKEPVDRYAAASEFAEAVRRALAAEERGSAPTEPRRS